MARHIAIREALPACSGRSAPGRRPSPCFSFRSTLMSCPPQILRARGPLTLLLARAPGRAGDNSSSPLFGASKGLFLCLKRASESSALKAPGASARRPSKSATVATRTTLSLKSTANVRQCQKDLSFSRRSPLAASPPTRPTGLWPCGAACVPDFAYAASP